MIPAAPAIHLSPLPRQGAAFSSVFEPGFSGHTHPSVDIVWQVEKRVIDGGQFL
jgi:hypothetical protein